MKQELQIFLTHAQAIDAVAADFSQYGPQPELHRDIASLVLGSDFKNGNAGEDDRAWIRRGPKDSFEPVDDTALVFYLIHVLENRETDPARIAEICTTLFQTPAVPVNVDGRAGVWITDQMNEFVCKRCGNCCRGLAHVCDSEDIRIWERHGRADILSRVGQALSGEGGHQYRIWVNPNDGKLEDECPFLAPVPGKNIFRCRIQTVKPRICKEYPFTIKHACYTGCKGFDMSF